jgi:hypothetical protein
MPDENLPNLPGFLRWQRPGPIGDPIDMEFLISEIENEELRNRLIAVALQTSAQVHAALAEGAKQAAGLFASSG